MKSRFFLCLLPALLAGAFNADARVKERWLQKSGYGLMFHYEAFKDHSPQSYNKTIDSFDVDRFVGEVESTGAAHIIFVIGQHWGKYCAPNSAYEKLLGVENGVWTSKRDLILEIGEQLAPAGREARHMAQRQFAQRILIATPVTLVALLRTVGLYWKQHDLAEGAREIQVQAEELHKRVATFVGHFAGIGKHLGQAQESYNTAVGSYERMVLPAGKRLEELNATKGVLPEPASIDKPVRAITAPLSFEDVED